MWGEGARKFAMEKWNGEMGGGEGLRKFVWDKWNGEIGGGEGLKKFVIEKWNGEMGGGEGLKKFAMEKWNKEMGGGEGVRKFVSGWSPDEVFPPESREKLLQWIKVGALYPVIGLLLIICVWFCGNVLVKAVRCICSCCLPAAKMMKAPGRAGVMIVRSVFESNPAAYFSALRA